MPSNSNSNSNSPATSASLASALCGASRVPPPPGSRLSGSEAAVVIVIVVLATLMDVAGVPIRENVQLLGLAGGTALALVRLAAARPARRVGGGARALLAHAFSPAPTVRL